MKKIIAKLLGLYTESELLSFGNYLLSKERGKRVYQEESDYTIMNANMKVASEKDLKAWINK
jgi:hypothetical protein